MGLWAQGREQVSEHKGTKHWALEGARCPLALHPSLRNPGQIHRHGGSQQTAHHVLTRSAIPTLRAWHLGAQGPWSSAGPPMGPAVSGLGSPGWGPPVPRDMGAWGGPQGHQTGGWGLGTGWCRRGEAQLWDLPHPQDSTLEAPDCICKKPQAQWGGYLSPREGGQVCGLDVQLCGKQAGSAVS